MSKNNQSAIKSNTETHSIKKLTAEQCSPDFLAQLLLPLNKKNWVSICPLVSQRIEHFIQLPHPLLIFNTRHWQAAEAVINESLTADYPRLTLQTYDQQTLFGRLDLHKGECTHFHQGEINNLNNGCLILDISPLLINPPLWFLLKAFMLTQNLPAISAMNGEKLLGHSPIAENKTVNTKIILVANRQQIDELSQVDPEYGQVTSLFTELPSHIDATDENVQSLQTYCYSLIEQKSLTMISNKALALLFHHLASLCEHQRKILFSPKIIENLLRYAKIFIGDETEISVKHLQQALDIEVGAQSLAQKFSEQALLESQLNIQLEGEEIGQINGMSVVELMGYPTEFGEVFRISASDMIGDGEIIDVERKVELAGNIHAKSTLIVQGYLHHLFTKISSFPLSCNVVFEQSYQESDGDSASLAILLAVTSCYAQQPVRQNLFVTGALDQHGNVLAIGGINQKIHSITRLFDLGLLDSPVTILIPQANTINLTLTEQTLALIRNNMINIHPINHCREAYPDAMSLTFKEVLTLIDERIEDMDKGDLDTDDLTFFERLMFLFK